MMKSLSSIGGPFASVTSVNLYKHWSHCPPHFGGVLVHIFHGDSILYIKVPLKEKSLFWLTVMEVSIHGSLGWRF